jgi:hypothetical protein
MKKRSVITALAFLIFTEFLSVIEVAISSNFPLKIQ